MYVELPRGGADAYIDELFVEQEYRGKGDGEQRVSVAVKQAGVAGAHGSCIPHSDSRFAIATQ